MDMTVQTRRLYRWPDAATYTAALAALGWQSGPPPGVALLPIGTTSSYYYVDALFTDLPPAAWEAQRVLDTAAPANIPRFARPRPPKGTLHVRDYGVVANGEVDDTDAMQRAIDAAAATGYALNLGIGTILLKPKSTQVYTYPPTNPLPVYRAVKLPRDPLYVFGEGARFVIGGSTPNGRAYMFATDQDLTDGATQNHFWENVTFDFDSGYASAVQGPYGLGYFSVTNLDFISTRFVNSALVNSGGTVNRGWGMSLLNARDVRISGLRSDRLSQTIATRYAFDWLMDGLLITNFGEAIDFDGVAERILASRFTFINGDQAIDLNSVPGLTLMGMMLDKVNNIIAVADKYTTPPTYAQYMAGETEHDPPDFPTGAKITVSNVTATDSIMPGFGSEVPVRVGIGRDGSQGTLRKGRPPPRDIILDNWNIEGGRYVYTYEADNICFRNWTLRNGRADGPNGGPCAFWLSSSTGGTVDTPEALADADLRAVIEDMTIINSPGGGVYIDRPGNVRIKGLRIQGYNLDGRTDAYGLKMSGLNARAGRIHVDHLDISGGNSPLADIYMDDTGVTAAGRVTFGNDIRLSAATPIKIAGVTTMRNVFPRAAVRILGINSIATAAAPHLIYVASGQSVAFLHCWLTFAAAVAAASGGNLTTWNLGVLRSATGVVTAINSGSLDLGYTAGKTIPLAPAIDKTPIFLADGDSIVLSFNRAGTGSVIGDVTVTTSVVPY